MSWNADYYYVLFGVVRALAIVMLKIAPLHIKKRVAIVELKVKFLPLLLQCTTIYGYAL